MKRPFFQKHALLILMLVCFCIPFGLRGARLGTRSMRNDVKDWLPRRFEETAQLEEFRKHFLGEAFVMVSWEGCTGTLDDEYFRRFINACFHETPPSRRDTIDQPDPSSFIDENLGMYVRQFRPSDVRDEEFVGNKFSLHSTGEFYENFVGLGEKWLRGEGRSWYYILPNGDLYRWEASEAPIAGLFRHIGRKLTGKFPNDATLVAETGPIDGPWYHEHPQRLEADLFKRVVTGPSMLADLTREGGVLEGDIEAAKDRLNGVVFGPDGKQTCCLVSLNDRSRANVHRIVGRGALGRARGRLLSISEQTGLKTPQRPSALPVFLAPLFASETVACNGPEIRLGGPPIDNVAIDEEGQITLVRLVGLSLLVGMTISWLSFRSWTVVLMLLFVGGVSAIFSLSLVWWCGSSLDAVLMSMPSLVYVLGLSGAVHIANYYRDTVDEEGYPGNPERALSHGWKPCGLAAITTALGLISLSTSDIVPIRKFGFFSALGVVFTLGLLFSFLPAALAIWPPKRFETRKDKDRGLSEYVTAFWNRVGAFCVRRNGLVTLASLAIMGLLAFGLPQIKTSVHLLKLFDNNNKIIKDYTWLESNLGKLVPMEILLRIDPALMRTGELDEKQPIAKDDKFRLSFLERMEVTEHVRREVVAHFGEHAGDIIGTPMLATSFVPPLPKPGNNMRATMVRGAYSRRLANYRPEIAESDFFRVDTDQSELWRISLRLSALSNLDYGEFIQQLKYVVEPVLSAYRQRYRVLDTIDQRRNGEGYRGTRILTLGAPLGKSSFASRLDESRLASHAADQHGPKASPPRKTRPSPNAAASATGQNQTTKQTDDEQDVLLANGKTIDQPAVFARTLLSLMQTSGVDYRSWHDPRYALPANWRDQLKNYDCIVIVQDDPRYNLAELELHAPVIDARDCVYQPESGSRTARDKGEPIAASYTGLVPIVYKAQRTLLQSLIESTNWAFVAILFVMIMLLRSPTAGLVSMLPNIFPVVVIFGWMGWSGVFVEIGTMMTASVAMGVAVDDTIHFLTWFRRGLDKGLPRDAAIMLAYDRCATAMTQTTLIAGLGLVVFGLSTFVPTQRFGIMMLTLMLAALVGDLIFLPAILAGPAGRAFRSRNDPTATPSRRRWPIAAMFGAASQPDNGPPVNQNGSGSSATDKPRPHLQGPHTNRLARVSRTDPFGSVAKDQ